MEINGSGFQRPVTQKELNTMKVCALFKKMGGETVPERMNRGRFPYPSQRLGFFKYSLDRPHRERLICWPARKQPLMGTIVTPVLSKDFKRCGGKKSVSVLLAFSLFYP
jgi:hypothetical protein